jgi:hypothetical protein
MVPVVHQPQMVGVELVLEEKRDEAEACLRELDLAL